MISTDNIDYGLAKNNTIKDYFGRVDKIYLYSRIINGRFSDFDN